MPMRPACCATTGRGRGTLFIDDGAAPENAELDTCATGNDLANGRACHRIRGQGIVSDALKNLETPWLRGRVARNGFISVGGHCTVSFSQSG